MLTVRGNIKVTGNLNLKPQASGGIIDADALAFITAWNTETGDTMGTAQQAVVNSFYLKLKGDTSNGSDLWTLFAGTSSVIYPYIPKDDSTAYINGFKIEAISKSSLGTPVNFTPSDATPSGMTGGSGKYFQTGVNTNAFSQDSIAGTFYAKTMLSLNTRAYGTPNFFSGTISSVGGLPTRTNSTTTRQMRPPGSVSDPKSMVRISSANHVYYDNGSLVLTFSDVSVTPDNYEIYTHALNNSGASSSYNNDQFCTFAFTVGLTATQVADFHECITYLNDNIITGGR